MGTPTNMDMGTNSPTSKRARPSSDIVVTISQGGERRGWLRANDRAMVVKLTFPHLSAQEKRQWLAALKGTTTGMMAEVQLGLKYSDYSTVPIRQRGKYQ